MEPEAEANNASNVLFLFCRISDGGSLRYSALTDSQGHPFHALLAVSEIVDDDDESFILGLSVSAPADIVNKQTVLHYSPGYYTRTMRRAFCGVTLQL